MCVTSRPSGEANVYVFFWAPAVKPSASTISIVIVLLIEMNIIQVQKYNLFSEYQFFL
jgi:hypothetical protein